MSRGPNLVIRAPFTPARRISAHMSWQANDPLGHYTEGDLAQRSTRDAVQELPLSVPPLTFRDLGQLNPRYEPWGGNPRSSAQTRSGGRRNYDPTIVPQFEIQSISGDSKQAEYILTGIDSDRSHAPGGYFEDEGDILQVEELSVESPFLNRSDTQAIHGITDEAYEAAALQLLPKLRPDSVGKWGIRGGRSYLHFSGAEGSWYRVESSTDLIHWKPILTGRAGHAGLELSPDCSDPCAFYRSVRLDGGNHRRQPGSHVRPARSSEEGRDPR